MYHASASALYSPSEINTCGVVSAGRARTRNRKLGAAHDTRGSVRAASEVRRGRLRKVLVCHGWGRMSEQSPKKRENSQPSSLSGVACSITTGKPLERAQRTSSANFLPVSGGGREVSSEQQGKESEGGGEGWASV